MPLELEHHALGLRTEPGLRAARDGERLWLRGETLTEELDCRLRGLPGLSRFSLLGDGRLVPVGCRVPRGRLPGLEWRSLHELFPVVLPPGALPGRLERRTRLRLVRTTREGRAEGLMLGLESWTDWCLRAPEARLQRLSFSCDAKRVFVRGHPLPPLPGERFEVVGEAAWPVGWRLEPELAPAMLVRVLGLQDGEFALFDSDGSWERMPARAFVRATRSAARSTAAEAARRG